MGQVVGIACRSGFKIGKFGGHGFSQNKGTGFTQLRSPTDGVVTERYVDPGDLIRAGSTNSAAGPLLRIQRVDRVRVSAHLPMDVLAAVDVGDKIVFEEYHNGYKATKGHHIYSGTKTIAPALALLADGEGLLTLDEPVVKTITEWKVDEQMEKITIRHLLTFTSGLKNND